MPDWTDLKAWMAACWKVFWNDEPLPFSVPLADAPQAVREDAGIYDMARDASPPPLPPASPAIPMAALAPVQPVPRAAAAPKLAYTAAGVPWQAQAAGRRRVGCQVCGANAPVKYVEFHQNVGALVVRFHRSVKGNLCKSCIHSKYWSMTGTTLAVGWLGTISLVLAPVFVVSNTVRYIGCLGMPSSHER